MLNGRIFSGQTSTVKGLADFSLLYTGRRDRGKLVGSSHFPKAGQIFLKYLLD